MNESLFEESVEGIVERVVYTNEASGWSVLGIDVPETGGCFTAVGNLPGIREGERLRMQGRWVENPRFGRQFQVAKFQTLDPDTLDGIHRFLSSGLIKGVGETTATRLIAHFGIDTLEILDRHPEKLTEVRGIGQATSTKIQASWEQHRGLKEVVIFLQSVGVGTAKAIRIFKTYGRSAIGLVRENPYRLSEEIFGVGFQTADQIARNLGIPEDSPFRIEAGLLHTLQGSASNGHIYLPQEKLVGETSKLLRLDSGLAEEGVHRLAQRGAVVREAQGKQSTVSLLRLYTAEASAADRLKELLASRGRDVTARQKKALAQAEKEIGVAFAPEQKKAALMAVSGSVTVITGGPGTGKTTLINAVLRMLEAEEMTALIAAPTGRAAKRLSQATGYPASTIHRLLEFQPRTGEFTRGEDNPLETQSLIVDEVSMVDAVLFDSLLRAVPDDCQIILVGDADQLPSVGPGYVLQDLIRSGVVPVVRLTEIFRQAQTSRIVLNAHLVNSGQVPNTQGSDEDSDFYHVARKDSEDALQVIREMVTQRIPQKFGFNPLEDIQVLTPMNRGALGAANLNAELQKHLNPEGAPLKSSERSLRVGDRVMQIRNNYDKNIFNGDVGRIEAFDKEEGEIRCVFDGRMVTLEASETDELLPAYACTIHKSQGSEFPAVVIALHSSHTIMLQRNLIYTALTRGRKLVVIVGDRKALAVAVRNDRIQERHTRLAERLIGEIQEAPHWIEDDIP